MSNELAPTVMQSFHKPLLSFDEPAHNTRDGGSKRTPSGDSVAQAFRPAIAALKRCATP